MQETIYDKSYNEVVIRDQEEAAQDLKEEEEKTDQDNQPHEQELLSAGTATYQVTHKQFVGNEKKKEEHGKAVPRQSTPFGHQIPEG